MREPYCYPAAACVAAGLLFGAASAAADACQTVLDAYVALSKTPAYRQTIDAPGATRMEMMAIGDTLYVKDEGDWTKLPLQPGMREEMMSQMVPDASALKNCEEVGSESLGGVSTTIYAYEPPPIEGVPDTGPQKVWIDGEGLPRRMTADQEDGRLEVDMYFDDVTAPIP